MTRRRWEISERVDDQTVVALAESLHLTPIVARLLLHRDISTPESANLFFAPNSSSINDPYLFDGMDRAVERILLARDRNEKIAIYGDNDVDGLTAITLLTRYLTRIGLEIISYIPQRSDTSYGLHEDGIAELKEQGVSLIITVDVGTTAVQAAGYAKDQGVDLIITDHHEPTPELPFAIAVINPKLPNSTYPFRELSGCAVAFKLAQALDLSLTGSVESTLPLLEFVALGTVADIVPLIGENRTLLSLGLAAIKESSLPGLTALCEVAGVDISTVTVDDLLMTLSPRINAAARMGNPYRALQLLLCDNTHEAGQLAVAIEQDNFRRRLVDDTMMRDAIDTLQSTCDPTIDSAIVLAKSGWHLGIIGILASRIAEMYHRPTVVLAIENGIGRGSARTVNGIDIHAALSACQEVLLQYGGHRCAAGLTLNESDIPRFTELFKNYVNANATPEELLPSLKIDSELPLDQIDYSLYREIQLLAPFGPGNPKPSFLAKRVEVLGTTKVVGQKHLRFKIRQRNKVFSAIALGMADRYHDLNGNRAVLDVCFGVDHSLNNWDNPIQLRILDFRLNKQ